MRLRDYQQECLQSIRVNLAAGVKRQLVSLPTGTGKTVVFAHLPNTLGLTESERVLIVAHREELIQQARAKLQAANPDASIGTEMAGQSAGPDEQIVVASIQSLVHRLDRHDPAAYKLVVCDEGHHAVGPTYRRIVAATPVRHTTVERDRAQRFAMRNEKKQREAAT